MDLILKKRRKEVTAAKIGRTVEMGNNEKEISFRKLSKQNKVINARTNRINH